MNSYENTSKNSFFKFFIPSVIGLIIFLFPIKSADGAGYTLLIGNLCQRFQDSLGEWNAIITGIAMLISAVGTIYVSLLKPKIKEHGFIEETFKAGTLNIVARVIGAIFFAMVMFNFGPGFVLNENIGPVMYDLTFYIGIWLIPSILLLPLMVDFGLMEFIGSLVNKLTRPLFKLPGRATVDLLTSWVGMVELGLVITNDQYEKGHYIAREAGVIASCFTATGVAFWLVCGEILGLSQYFIQFYIAIFIAGFLSVTIMTRIPPLSKVSDKYYVQNENNIEEKLPEGTSKLKFAVLQGMKKAESAEKPSVLIKNAVLLILNLFVTLVPIVMFLGVIAMTVIEYTPIFDWLAIPFEYYLKLLQVPEAQAAAPATIAGFADMFIPVLISSGIASTKTRFIIGVLTLTQIVFMSEMGAYVLVSKIPLKFKDLLIIFIEKTIILLPIIVLLANIMKIPA